MYLPPRGRGVDRGTIAIAIVVVGLALTAVGLLVVIGLIAKLVI
jgi:hypothetical protein